MLAVLAAEQVRKSKVLAALAAVVWLHTLGPQSDMRSTVTLSGALCGEARSETRDKARGVAGSSRGWPRASTLQGLMQWIMSEDSASWGFACLWPHMKHMKEVWSLRRLCSSEAGKSDFTYGRVPAGSRSCSPAIMLHELPRLPKLDGPPRALVDSLRGPLQLSPASPQPVVAACASAAARVASALSRPRGDIEKLAAMDG